MIADHGWFQVPRIHAGSDFTEMMKVLGGEAIYKGIRIAVRPDCVPIYKNPSITISTFTPCPEPTGAKVGMVLRDRSVEVNMTKESFGVI